MRVGVLGAVVARMGWIVSLYGKIGGRVGNCGAGRKLSLDRWLKMRIVGGFGRGLGILAG